MLAEQIFETPGYVPYAEARFRNDFLDWFVLECAVGGDASMEEPTVFDFLARLMRGRYTFVLGSEGRFLVFSAEADGLWPLIVSAVYYRGYCWHRGRLVGKVVFDIGDIRAAA
jgi:hypothetical protein